MQPVPSEILALQERADRADAENQRLHEIVSDKCDLVAVLRRRVHDQGQIIDALRGELRLHMNVA